MNKFFCFLFILAFNLSSIAQSSETLAKEQINMAMKFQESSWNRGDISSFMDAYWKSDSLLFVGGKGAVYGWSNTLINYLKRYPNKTEMGTLTFENIKVDILSDSAATVVGKWQLERDIDDLGGWYSLIWKKKGQKWKIVLDHSSSH